MNIKLPALKLLKMLSNVRDYRVRMVSAGAGERLIHMSMDPLFDSKTRAAAAALWIYVSETEEGRDPRWWSCLRSEISSSDAVLSPEAEMLKCRSSLQVKLLLSNEADSEVVGAKGAISLSYQGDEAKATFIQCGGLEALVHVLRQQPQPPLRVLAPLCTAILNLSSFVPAQPRMTLIVDRLIRLNTNFYSQSEGHSKQSDKISSEQEGKHGGHSPSHEDTAEDVKSRDSTSPYLQDNESCDNNNLLIEEVLYGTSGALNNLSKHPDNVSCLYAIELSRKTEEAWERQGEPNKLKKTALPSLSQQLRQPTQEVWASGLAVDVHRGPALLLKGTKGPLVRGARKSDRWDPLVSTVKEDVRIVKSEILEDVSLTFKQGGQQVTSTVSHFKPKPRGGWLAAVAREAGGPSKPKDSSVASSQRGDQGQGQIAQVLSMKDQLSSLLSDLDDRLGFKKDLGEGQNATPHSTVDQGRLLKSQEKFLGNKNYSLAVQEKHIKDMESQAEAYRRKTTAEFAHNPKTTIWPKVEGSIFSEGLFTPYDLPKSNSSVFIYQDRKRRVDELPGNGLGDATESGDGKSKRPGSGSGGDDVALAILSLISDLPFDPTPPRPFSVAGVPPSPGTHTIPSIDELTSIHAQVFPRPLAPGEPETVADKPEGPPWSLESSIFAPRPKQTDSKDYYDDTMVYQKGLDNDWKLCMSKERFGKLVGKYLQPSEMKDLMVELKGRYGDALRVFDYYSAYSAGSSFALHSNGWSMMCSDCELVDERSESCKASDLDRLFIAVNFEEDKKSEAANINLDNAMIRTEFLEAIIRIAIAKFCPLPLGKKQASGGGATGPNGLTKAPVTLVSAVTLLLDNHLLPLSQPEARVESNFFRITRLYTEQVDLLLTSRKAFLKAIFDHYRSITIDPTAGAAGDARLDMEEWLVLIQEGGVYHRYFNVREAKLAFLWSRMKCIDECGTTKNMSRAHSLSFLDFLEALSRVSDLMSPPPPEDLVAMGFSEAHDYFTQATSTGYYCPDRASGAFDAQSFTRPLEAKIEQVLGMISENLFSKFGSKDEQNLMMKLKRRRNKDGTIAIAG